MKVTTMASCNKATTAPSPNCHRPDTRGCLGTSMEAIEIALTGKMI
ncbi:MAG: hypothetical protein IPN88_04625 [Bacteroidetes bacterium]|nr:hypothetical protein [Bacteroidota bacterium]